MADPPAVQRTGAVLAMGVSACYAVAIVSYLVTPEAALDASRTGPYLTAVLDNRALFSTLWGSQALAGLLGLGVVPAVASTLARSRSGWVGWLSALAYLGFALIAIDYARLVTMVPLEAAAWASSDDAIRPMIAGDFLHLPLSGDFLKMMPLAVWLTGVGWLGLRSGALPGALAALALGVGAGHLGLAVEDLVSLGWFEPLAAVIAGVGGAVWYAWLGVALVRATTAAPGESFGTTTT